MYIYTYFFLFFFSGLTHSRCKFLGQGWNLHHGSCLSHNSDNAGSLT